MGCVLRSIRFYLNMKRYRSEQMDFTGNFKMFVWVFGDRKHIRNLSFASMKAWVQLHRINFIKNAFFVLLSRSKMLFRLWSLFFCSIWQEKNCAKIAKKSRNFFLYDFFYVLLVLRIVWKSLATCINWIFFHVNVNSFVPFARKSHSKQRRFDVNSEFIFPIFLFFIRCFIQFWIHK